MSCVRTDRRVSRVRNCGGDARPEWEVTVLTDPELIAGMRLFVDDTRSMRHSRTSRVCV